MNKKLILIFSGYNQRAIISFIRTLEKNKLDYGIIASSRDDIIFLTKYRKKVLCIRKSIKIDIKDIHNCLIIIQKKTNKNNFWIAPSTESLNRFFLENRPYFKKLGCQIPLVTRKKYELISDKYKFSNLCKKNKINIPKEYINIKKIPIPFVAKPKKYLSKTGEYISPILIFNENDKFDFIKNFSTNDFYYQEYISGKSFYLLYYFNKKSICNKLSQKNLIQQPQGKHIIAAKYSTIHASFESTKYEKLFKKIKFRGLVMVEIIDNGKNKYMIEANPRFWGPSQLFVDSGVNLFDNLLEDYSFIQKIKKTKNINTKARYYWHRGFLETKNKKGKCVYYDYLEKLHIKNINNWTKIDIYNRKDTIGIYKKETTNEKYKK